ncbi:MAG: ABC transporter permease [Candidatus Margulisiibacteriota bacterium]
MKIIVRRLILSLPLLFAITVISFFLMHLAPGDPSTILIDPKIRPEDMLKIKHNLGLDKPIILQYFYWLKALFQGNLGFSLVNGKSVLVSIVERLPATLILSLASLILTLIFSFFLGLISAYKKGSFFDQVMVIVCFLGLAIPSFWLGIILILFFSLQLNLLPSSGFIDPYLTNVSLIEQIFNLLGHLILPLITISVASIASLTLYNRFQVLNILNQDYIIAARARGLKESRILFKHAFKNAALPLVTLLGLELPGLIGGAFIIEYIFAWPGMGQLGIQSIFARDYPVLMGILLFSAILIIIGNFLADFCYQLVDPRI